MRRTKIVCTIGPSSDEPEQIAALLKAGMNVARLNLSHGSRNEQLGKARLIKEVSSTLRIPCAIMADLRGPEIRTVQKAESLELTRKDSLEINLDREPAGNDAIACSHPEILVKSMPGDRLILGDGAIILEVVESQATKLLTKVIDGGMLFPKQRITLPGKAVDLPALVEEDYLDIEAFSKEGVDFFAQSFVRSASDIAILRKELTAFNSTASIVAKIEKASAVDNSDEILEFADAIMVARGDLGIEMPPEDVPIIQKDLIKSAMLKGKPVIIATQMLESMIDNIRPTRAEASDVANAIFDGADAIMLSGETATGNYPVAAVKMMDKIAVKTEGTIDYGFLLKQKRSWLRNDPTSAISYSSCELAENLDAKAIITSTQSGTTARQVSRYRPGTPIIAITTSKETFNKLLLSWGITPAFVTPGRNTDELFDKAHSKALELNAAKPGEILIITAGVLVNMPGTTNLIKVQVA